MGMKLYKYRSLETWYDEKEKKLVSGIEYCVDIIKNNRLYLPKREKLNDPYEGCAIPINLAVCGSGIFSSMGCLHPAIEDEMNSYRVLSLSSTAKSMPMWAHYAGNYNGVCFEFDSDGKLGCAQKMDYIEVPFAGVSELDVSDFSNIVRQNFYYKSKNWDYEKEYRIVEQTSNEFFEFERKDISKIIVGFKALERTDVRKQIINLARKKEIPIYKVFLTPRRYELSFMPIEKNVDWGEDVIDRINVTDIY